MRQLRRQTNGAKAGAVRQIDRHRRPRRRRENHCLPTPSRDNCAQNSASLRRFSHFRAKMRAHLVNSFIRLHHDAGGLGVQSISPLAKVQALHVAAHIDAVDRLLRPRLDAGGVVILDRFWWSAWVYGIVAGCNRRKLRALIAAERAAWGTIQPAIAVLLKRAAPIDRNDPPVQWRELVRAYERLAQRERTNYPVEVIENATTGEDTAAKLLSHLGKIGITHRRPASAEAHQLMIGFTSSEHSTKKSLSVLTHLLPVRPTIAYDSYWKFAAERQEIFFKRIEGSTSPVVRG